ncbi:transporter [Sphingomonas sp. Leaf357]|uniref:efflux transporter outer membrane subunit n=1 Tax=Sphingomonas sp. Leaf357 TaxID=1736350 RepID=UPI0006F8D17F|nr:efflux transporter outer membrane subunit [Sphingomonas sp. Leaf357]KQS03852.1 transporter [Sphingomonas sp. Leaf357]
MIRIRTLALLLAASSLAACDMAPKYVRTTADVAPQQWPAGAAYAPAAAGQAGLPWRTVFGDAKLQQVISQALANNRDLRAAVANIASARAQYRVQRSAQFPTLAASGGATISRTISGSGGTGNLTNPAGASYSTFSADVGVSAFELDLFGRQKNLSRAAFEQYLATESGARSTRLILVADTASAYATLAADGELLRVATEMVGSGQRTVKLTQSLHDVGLVTGSDLADAETVLAQAQSDVERYTTQVAQDRNALNLLVGAAVADALLPASLDGVDKAVGNVPAGLSSSVLAERPDVVEAEHRVKSAYASIGAAKAAFFPQISLTSAIGVASSALTSLFTGGVVSWSASPSVSLPILGGTNRGNLDYAKAQADYYQALYEKAIQTAFRDVADGLARQGTIARQRTAQARLVAAANRSYTIADARYRAGTDSFLTALVAQRTLYSARQAAISVQLEDVANRVTLYQAIGSDESLGSMEVR